MQCSVKYEIVGEGSATFFFSVDTDGQVSVRQPLTSDTATRYKISVVAYGSCDPALRDYAAITVTVVRNAHPPVFNMDVYDVSISENDVIGTVVVTVEAEDDDSVSETKYILKTMYTHVRYSKLFFFYLITGSSWRADVQFSSGSVTTKPRSSAVPC